MVTTVANELVKPFHPLRMPVILDPDDYGTWLGRDDDAAFALLKPYPSDRMFVLPYG